MGLQIDLAAIVANWTALAGKAPGARASSVVKADAYGLGAGRVVPSLHAAGCRDLRNLLLSEERTMGAGDRCELLLAVLPERKRLLCAQPPSLTP